jgi:DNA modification methylase
LAAFGVVEPVVVNKATQHIVGGHQRVYAAEAEGIAEMPVVWVDLDDVGEKQLNLALNRISGAWDQELLEALLKELKVADADMELTGFSEDELARYLQEVADGETDPDAVPSDVPRRAEPGSLWELGRHRLLCGDATNADDLARVFDGAAPTLCITDPPYGVNYDPQWRNEAERAGHIDKQNRGSRPSARRVGEVENDDRADWSEVWGQIPCSVIYAWSAGGDLSIAAGSALIASGFQIRAQLIWRKPHFPISRGHYTFQHEPCWYAVKKRSKADWIGDKTQSSVWEVSLDKNVAGGHSTQKPVELFTRAITNHKGDVFEPFSGSGTCIIACEQLMRVCYAMELKPEYCDVAIERWQQFTGREATEVK